MALRSESRTDYSEYSPIQHLSRSVFINGDRSEHLMLMLSGYFDKSGQADQAATVVCGYVSTVDKWEQFEIDWRLVLAKTEVPYFHMTDFVACRAPFDKGWKGNEQKRKRFLNDLIEIIKSYALRTFSSTVINTAFDEVNIRYQLSEYAGNPYAFCGRNCAGKVRQWKDANHADCPIEYIFESGDIGKGKLMEIFERDGFPLPIFKPKVPAPGREREVFTPLQVADFAGWEQLKSVRQKEAGELEHFRKSFEALALALPLEPKDWGIFDIAHLEQFCRDSGVPER